MTRLQGGDTDVCLAKEEQGVEGRLKKTLTLVARNPISLIEDPRGFNIFMWYILNMSGSFSIIVVKVFEELAVPRVWAF